MLSVNTKLSVNKNIITVKADENIPKGAKIWSYSHLTCHVFWKKQFYIHCLDLPINDLINVIRSSYIKNGVIYMPSDNTRYISHSTTPNTVLIDENLAVSTRNIKKGETLTKNYNISHDKDDFYFWSLIDQNTSKSEILTYMKAQLFKHGKPRSSLSF